MTLFKKKTIGEAPAAAASRPQCGEAFTHLDSLACRRAVSARLYSALRASVPVADAAIYKIVRLTGGFRAVCGGGGIEEELNAFLENIPVDGGRQGIESFASAYLEQLLTAGTALGEILVSPSGAPCALCNVPLPLAEFRRSADGFGVEVLSNGKPVRYPELVLMSALNPEPGEITGRSLLEGLPFIGETLMKIFSAIGQNWERAGNVRFAVTYKPLNDAGDRAFAKERAEAIAREWGEAMRTGAGVRDFVAVGDVSIKAIGADSQILDSEIPVRQLLEQIIAKTGLPPFMLGLSWSSTERMSAQQADVLTSELEYYRRILTPVLVKICRAYLASRGYTATADIEWNDITLQDETELARARLWNAQAAALESKEEKA